MGVQEYIDWAPKNSFIALDQFKSVDELARRLLYLNRNDTAYLKYLEWTESAPVRSGASPPHISVTPDRPFATSRLCHVCRQLTLRKEANAAPKHYPNIHKWWVEDARCEEGFTKRFVSKADLADFARHPETRW